MADDKLKTGPEPPGPDRPGDAPVKEAPPIQEPPVQETNAPGKTQEPAAPGTGPALQAEQSVIPGMGEDNPARSALGEVVVDFDKINELMSQRQAAAHGAVDKLKAPATDKDGKEAPIPEEKAPEADQPKKRRGRPPKEQAAVSAGKKEKAAEPRTGRPSKVDKAAREEAPPAVRDKVSRGKKADKGKETGSGGAPASKPAQAVKPGKAAPVKEAAVPPPEINLPPTPDVPPRPVEEGKIVYLKMAELHPFHTFREHPYKVQDDKAMDDLVGTIKEHGIMTPATVRPEKDGKGYEIIAGHRRHHGGTRAGLEEMPCMKKRRRVLLLRILRFFSRFHRLDGGFYNFQFFFVQEAQHGVNPLSALAPFILGRIEILIYRYIKHCYHLIKGVEAGVLAVILVIHDGARSPVNNIGQLLLCHPAGFPCPLDGEPYIVKIKPSFISFNLHNIT